MFTNLLMTEVLRTVVAPAALVTKQPADIVGLMPLVYVHKSAGTELHPEWADVESVQVDVYTNTGERDCYQLAAKVRKALFDAWLYQTVYESGHIAFIETVSTPFEFPDSTMPDGVSRYTAEYQLTVRAPIA